jgi:hypothetical protein
MFLAYFILFHLTCGCVGEGLIAICLAYLCDLLPRPLSDCAVSFPLFRRSLLIYIIFHFHLTGT